MQNTYEIHSSRSAEAFLNSIKAQTEILREFVYLRWIDLKTGDYFYGTFKQNTFKLVVRECGRNFVTPVMEGEVLPEGEGSILRYTMKKAPDVKFAYGMASLIGFFFCILCIDGIMNMPGVYIKEGLLFSIGPLFPVIYLGILTAINKSSMDKFGKAAYERFCQLAKQSSDESHDAR